LVFLLILWVSGIFRGLASGFWSLTLKIIFARAFGARKHVIPLAWDARQKHAFFSARFCRSLVSSRILRFSNRFCGISGLSFWILKPRSQNFPARAFGARKLELSFDWDAHQNMQFLVSGLAGLWFPCVLCDFPIDFGVFRVYFLDFEAKISKFSARAFGARKFELSLAWDVR